MQCQSQVASNAASEYSFGDERRKQFGLNINQISCFYDGTDCTNDLHWYWQYDYGSCFQFNVGLNYTNGYLKRKMANIEGIENGLWLTVNNFSKSIKLKAGIYPGLGMKVFVHNRTLQPRWYAEGLNVKPGEISMIGVKRTFVRMQRNFVFIHVL